MVDEGRFSEDALPELLARIWFRVMAQVNRLIKAHETFEYVTFAENLNPSIEDVLKGFEFADFALTKFLDSGQLAHDETRNALNAKQCILSMKLLAAALNSDDKDQDEYERIMRDLRNQAQI
ncbi:hypothetical protein [Xanthomonas euvesicatoria]|uniref:Uncharacterized protein n=1 Tax=Xanthomonas euvesicatoria TaxID=456327 RepID=A0AAW3UA75_XANEU|nr:hypothetical protein [Xanthomonas euvesicatoria]MBB4725590.1 hypothetical protein [Xanthomonas euvesicatoria]MBB4872183.1 hypothetical protein [Xanthomonas euvesicatoria]OCG95365.1 hypothetical protein LMG918_14170 [Xanthomonas euvesicatoria]